MKLCFNKCTYDGRIVRSLTYRSNSEYLSSISIHYFYQIERQIDLHYYEKHVVYENESEFVNNLQNAHHFICQKKKPSKFQKIPVRLNHFKRSTPIWYFYGWDTWLRILQEYYLTVGRFVQVPKVDNLESRRLREGNDGETCVYVRLPLHHSSLNYY